MADWSRRFSTSFRFVRVDRLTGLEGAAVTNVRNGWTYEYNQDKDHSTGSLDFAGALDLGSDLLRCYLVADFGDETATEALWTAVVSVPKRTRKGALSTGQADLAGRLSEVAEDEFDAPFTVPAGTNAVAYAAGLLEEAGFSEVIADESDYVTSTDWTLGLDAGDSKLAKRLSAVNALLSAAGFASAREDAYGRPVLRRYVEPADKPVRATLREGAGARFLDEATDELDRSGVANVVHADYETEEAFFRGVAVDSDPDSPYSTVSRGWRKAATYSFDDLPAGSTDAERQAAADAKAAELLRTQQSAIRRLSVTSVYMPVSDGDAVEVDWPGAQAQGKFVVRVKTVRGEAACPLELELRRYER